MADNHFSADKAPNAKTCGSLGTESGAMSERLKALITLARQVHMTPEQERDQEIGFALGNAQFENPRITRELVEQSIPESQAGMHCHSDVS